MILIPLAATLRPWLVSRALSPGIPHHVTQRGNGRQQAVFTGEDYAFYRNLLRRYCAEHGVAIWAWVLMPNHVQLILVPETEDSLRAALSKVRRAYAGHIHAREKRTGHFWQGRFGCVAVQERISSAGAIQIISKGDTLFYAAEPQDIRVCSL